MTPNKFRQLAVRLPESCEGEHMNHPDFRVGGKIFATLWPDDNWGMVKLTPVQQAEFVHDYPDVFEPVKGSWGLKGATRVKLTTATVDVLRPALYAAWLNTAPKRLVEKIGDDFKF